MPMHQVETEIRQVREQEPDARIGARSATFAPEGLHENSPRFQRSFQRRGP